MAKVKANLKDLKAAKEALVAVGATEQDLAAIKSIAQLKNWAKDAGYELEDETTRSSGSTIPTIMQGNYELVYASAENEPAVNGVQAYIVSVGYAEESRKLSDDTGGFAAVTLVIGRKQMQLNLPVEQLIVAIAAGAFGIQEGDRAIANSFLPKIRAISNNDQRVALRKEIGAWMKNLNFSPDFVTINGRFQEAGKTTWYVPVGKADEIEDLKVQYPGVILKVTKALRDSRPSDSFSFERDEMVTGALVFHATTSISIIGMTKSSKLAFDQKHGDVVSISTDVNRIRAFDEEKISEIQARNKAAEDVATIEYLDSLPSTTRDKLLKMDKYASLAPLYLYA